MGGPIPLKNVFPALYWAATKPLASVVENYDLQSHSWDVEFKRSFGFEEMAAWGELQELIQEIFLSEEEDVVRWSLETKGEYSTKSLYRWLSYQGVSDVQLQRIWKLKVPMKIRIFLWQVIQDRLPTREQIFTRK